MDSFTLWVRSATAFRVHHPYSVKREFQCRTNLCSIASTKSNSCYIIKFASFGQCSFSVGPADSKFWRLWRRECVLVLTQQIKKITQIHGAPEEVILFVASNKFMFSFKRWYNQQISQVMESCLKTRIDQNILYDQKPFYAATQRIEARS